MKKELALFLVLIIPFISAIDIELSKGEYFPRETLQAEFSGSFDEITRSNVLIFEEGKVRSQPVISEVALHEGKYYFYALLPNREGNFSVVIDGVRYIEDGITKTEPISQDFIIERSNASGPFFSFNPGFTFASDEATFTVKNLRGEAEQTYKVANTDIEQISFFPLENDVDVVLDISSLTQDSNFELAGYKVPIFKVIEPIIITPPARSEILFIPQVIEGTAKVGTQVLSNVIIVNQGESNATNISFVSDVGIKTVPTIIPLLQPKQRIEITLTIPIIIEEGTMDGEIMLVSSEINSTLPINFNVTKIEEQVELNNTTVKPELGCADIGNVCDFTIGEVCDGEFTASSDGPCCIGKCVVEEELLSVQF